MTDLHESIRSAISRTRTERDLPANVLEAIERAGYVVIQAERWERVREYADANLAWESRDGWGRDVSGGVVSDPETTYGRLTRAKQRLKPGDLDPSAEG